MLLPGDFLEEIKALLDEKRQIVLQGPPGTGKTFVALALANYLAGSKERVTLVQFHASYAYEDFVQGYRPVLGDNQQHGFALTDGPLIRAAEAARDEPQEKHYLIIDEIKPRQSRKGIRRVVLHAGVPQPRYSLAVPE